jgi:hypothetical protein
MVSIAALAGGAGVAAAKTSRTRGSERAVSRRDLFMELFDRLAHLPISSRV